MLTLISSPLIPHLEDAAPPARAVRFLVEATGAGMRDSALEGHREKKRRSRSTRMICVSVQIREGALTYRVRVSAPSIEHALKIVREGKPGRRVRLVFPIDPKAYFVPENSDQREAA